MRTKHAAFKTTRLVWRSLFFLLILLIQLSSNTSYAGELWSNVDNEEELKQDAAISTQHQNILHLDVDELKLQLSAAAKEFSGAPTISMELPLPNGSFERFQVYESPIMEEGLAQKFQGIHTYSVVSEDHQGVTGRLDISHKGFHAIIFTKEGTIYIDPLNAATRDVAVSYYQQDHLPGDKALETNCVLPGEESRLAKREPLALSNGNGLRPSGDELRTYRLAVATTGEYTSFHGGTVVDGLAAVVTSINRVVGVYEREIDVRLILVADNDLIIYTNGFTDPFSNNNTGQLINQGQTVIDNIIGSANYDVGHTFSTGAGGLASLGVPCINGAKANGVTGISAPIGDPFDIDYVAHELGHQFGAGHTFNGSSGSCNGNIGSNAYEVGSGTTIMAYAGICNPQNIQDHSDDYFHGVSYDQIIAYTQLSAGNDCPVITNTGNTAPEVGPLASGFTIPKETPFELTGNATDPDEDELTFQWEQFDLGPQGHPNSPSGNAPIFRSFLSTLSPTRIFPQISDIVNNTQTLGEILPTYARDLRFRFNARDNKLGGGGLDHGYISLSVDGESGPFLVTAPSVAASYEVNSTLEVTWDVANTSATPVNCQSVNILLSLDGGYTYPVTLLEGTANDGAASINIPNEITTTARIKVEAADNVFFDISNEDFVIVEPIDPDFYVDVPSNSLSICTPADAIYSIDVEQLAGFSATVSLEITNPPAGVTIDFSNNNFVPTQNSILTVGNTIALPDGIYEMDLQVSGDGTIYHRTLTLEVFNALPSIVGLVSPENSVTELPLQQTCTWLANASSARYDFELADDAGLTNILANYTGTATSYEIPFLLTPATNYYWRVRGMNTCGDGSWSAVYTFKTDALSCTIYDAEDLPINIPSNGFQTITSKLTVVDDFEVSDVNLLNLTGEHTWISDLDAILKSPSGTEVVLFSGPCNDEDDFDISFDDDAASGATPCPMTDAMTYQPKESLSAFYGESSMGDWELTIIDNYNQDGGELSTWSLELCQLASNIISAPGTPADLAAIAVSPSQIDLTWRDIADDETSYEIERSPLMNSAYSMIAVLDAGSESYTDIGLNVNTAYFYKVRAAKPTIYSAYSNIAVDTTFDSLAHVATDLIATAISPSKVEVTWTDNSSNEIGFIVDRSTTDNSSYNTIDTVVANVLGYDDRGLLPGVIYYYKVAPYSTVGTSEYSVEDSALTHESETTVFVIDPVLDKSIDVFPNPTTDHINLAIQFDLTGTLELSLFDAAGRSVIQQSYIKSERAFYRRLDFGQLPSGLYLLKIELEEAVTFRKIQVK